MIFVDGGDAGVPTTLTWPANELVKGYGVAQQTTVRLVAMNTWLRGLDPWLLSRLQAYAQVLLTDQPGVLCPSLAAR